jgi:DNA-binding transcriptional LysR family regulator
MVLTAAGNALLEHARRAMLELDRGRAEVGGSPGLIAGMVTIGLLPSASEILSSPLVRAVARHYPGIRVHIAMGYAGNLQQWLEVGEIDAAILYGVERAPQVQATPLLEEPLWVVGPTTARLRRQRPVSLASLVGRPMILPYGPHGIRTLVDHACAISNVTLSIVAQTNAMSIQKSLVLGGHGLTILPPIAFARELANKQLSAAPLKDPPIFRTIALGLPATRSISQPVRRTVDLLIECTHEAVMRKEWPHSKWIAAGKALSY